MTSSIFGTDGIRGPFGQGLICPDFFNKAGTALAQALREEHSVDIPRVVITRDTRESGPVLLDALIAGLQSAGAKVYDLGVLPTAAAALFVSILGAHAGAVISASHNPAADNGLKLFDHEGHKLGSDSQARLGAWLNAPVAFDGEQHEVEVLPHAAATYATFASALFPSQLSLNGLNVVVDCAHGAASHIAPDVLEALGATVTAIGCNPTGTNINDGVGATDVKALARLVIEAGADLGVAFDGDADRLVMVDSKGRLADGDVLLYLMAQGALLQGQAVPGVVGTVMTNIGIEKEFGKMGVEFVRAAVGDKYIVQELLKRGWSLGGESSGHLMDLNKLSTGDGLVAAMGVLAALKQSGQTLAQWVDKLTWFPSKLTKLQLREKEGWNTPLVQAELASVTQALGERGRVLVRPSGTEPVLRILVEGDSADYVAEISKKLTDRLHELCLG